VTVETSTWGIVEVEVSYTQQRATAPGSAYAALPGTVVTAPRAPASSHCRYSVEWQSFRGRPRVLESSCRLVPQR